MKADDNRRALEEWNETIRLYPEYLGAYFYRARTYETLGLPEKAISDLTVFLQRSPKSAIGFATRGIIEAEQGKIEQGLRDCNRALALDPKHALGFALRGDVYRLKGDYRKALEDAGIALQLNPKLARANQVQGRAYHEMKDYRRAIRAYNEALRGNPKWTNPLIARADAYNALGDYKAARADYRRARELAPRLAGPHNALAWFLATCPVAAWRDGKTAVQEATLACSLSQWKDPDDVDSLAAALAETGEFVQAAKREEEALRMSPPEKRKSFEKRLASFRQKQPWREAP